MKSCNLGIFLLFGAAVITADGFLGHSNHADLRDATCVMVDDKQDPMIRTTTDDLKKLVTALNAAADKAKVSGKVLKASNGEEIILLKTNLGGASSRKVNWAKATKSLWIESGLFAGSCSQKSNLALWKNIVRRCKAKPTDYICGYTIYNVIQVNPKGYKDRLEKPMSTANGTCVPKTMEKNFTLEKQCDNFLNSTNSSSPESTLLHAEVDKVSPKGIISIVADPKKVAKNKLIYYKGSSADSVKEHTKKCEAFKDYLKSVKVEVQEGYYDATTEHLYGSHIDKYMKDNQNDHYSFALQCSESSNSNEMDVAEALVRLMSVDSPVNNATTTMPPTNNPNSTATTTPPPSNTPNSAASTTPPPTNSPNSTPPPTNNPNSTATTTPPPTNNPNSTATTMPPPTSNPNSTATNKPPPTNNPNSTATVPPTPKPTLEQAAKAWSEIRNQEIGQFATKEQLERAEEYLKTTYGVKVSEDAVGAIKTAKNNVLNAIKLRPYRRPNAKGRGKTTHPAVIFIGGDNVAASLASDILETKNKALQVMDFWVMPNFNPDNVPGATKNGVECCSKTCGANAGTHIMSNFRKNFLPGSDPCAPMYSGKFVEEAPETKQISQFIGGQLDNLVHLYYLVNNQDSCPKTTLYYTLDFMKKALDQFKASYGDVTLEKKSYGGNFNDEFSGISKDGTKFTVTTLCVPKSLPAKTTVAQYTAKLYKGIEAMLTTAK